MKPPVLSAAILAAALATTAIPAFSQENAEQQGNDPLNAVVKLEVSKTYPNIYRPWVNIRNLRHLVEMVEQCRDDSSDSDLIAIRSGTRR